MTSDRGQKSGLVLFYGSNKDKFALRRESSELPAPPMRRLSNIAAPLFWYMSPIRLALHTFRERVFGTGI